MYIKTLPAMKVGISFLLFYILAEAPLVWNEWSTADLSTQK